MAWEQVSTQTSKPDLRFCIVNADTGRPVRKNRFTSQKAVVRLYDLIDRFPKRDFLITDGNTGRPLSAASVDPIAYYRIQLTRRLLYLRKS